MPNSTDPRADATRRGSTRLAGLAIAGVVGLASAGLVLWFALASRPRQTPAAGAAAEAPPVEAPNLRDLSLAGSTGQAQLTRSGRTLVQWSDKADPTRKAGELEYRTLQPLEAKRYLMHEPRARIHLRDGRTVTIGATRARVYWPSTQNTRPESASLEGDVVIRLFERGVDPEEGTPTLTMNSPTFAFDGTLGELSTPDRLTLASPSLDYSGIGMRLVYNEVRERIELLRVDSGHSLSIREGAPEDRHAPPRADLPPSGPAASGNAQPPPASALVTLYQARLLGDVVLGSGDRHMTGDRLDLWARLTDNRLAPGALGRSPARAEGPTPHAAVVSPAPVDPTAPADPRPPGELRLTWSGPLELNPIEAWPVELGGNQVAGRLTGDAGVRFWQDLGHEGRAEGVEYLATTQDLSAWGTADAPVRLTAQPGQELQAERIAFNLATGIGQVRGPGMIRGGIVRPAPSGTPAPDPRIGGIAWREQADFIFDVSRTGGPAGQLREAAFAGDVRLREDLRHDAPGLRLDAPAVRTHFAPAVPGGPALLRRLAATEGVRAGDGRGASIDAAETDLTFAPGERGDDVVPSVASARGSVLATRDGTTMTADALDARMRRVRGATEVERVIASGSVRFDQPDGTSARADYLAADVPRQLVDLVGLPASVEQRGGRIESESIRLDGLQKRAETPGAGRFTQRPAEGGHAGRVVATWDRSMIFDDLAGTLECDGAARVESATNDLSIDSATAETVRASFTPSPLEPATPGEPRADRQLLHVRLEALPGDRATVESRRLASDARSLERMVYIESEVLDLDAAAGVFTAPNAGRLVASDRRPATAAPRLAPAPAMGRGDTLIDWDGSMCFDRGAGLATLDRGVRLAHSPPAGDLVNLECDTLTASITPARHPATLAALDAGADLQRAVGTGAVWLRSGTRELTSGTVEYDARTGVSKALAAPGASVVFLDPATGAPVRAPAMIWDMRGGRIEVVRPETIVIPR